MQHQPNQRTQSSDGGDPVNNYPSTVAAKKKPAWWRKFVPSCGTSNKPPGPRTTTKVISGRASRAPDGQVSLACAKCGVIAEVANSACAFVCDSCHRVNRISADEPRRLSVVADEDMHEIHHLVRTSSSTFHPVSDNVEARPAEPVVPQCQVCMDGPGDMVLLPCSHGAICEACAKHIAKNLSVGGNHCIKCREEIKQLVRLSELYPETATGVTVRVPKDQVQKGPPRVPPPPGLAKSKPPAEAKK